VKTTYRTTYRLDMVHKLGRRGMPTTTVLAKIMSRAAHRRYVPPASVSTVGLWELLDGVREVPPTQRSRLALPGFEHLAQDGRGPTLLYSGSLELVKRKCVAIVGSRKVSAEGAARARRLARELVEAGVVVVSGLAEGVDTNAHTSAIESGGRTIAVIGTPIESAYPAKNARLQEIIYRDHLLVSPFPLGSRVFRSNFPQRNKVMAAIADATVIVEASDTSGSLHQAAECAPRRLNRWLFIPRSVVENPDLEWPKGFLGSTSPKTRVLEKTSDILDVLAR
jgi:DNA processing protein